MKAEQVDDCVNCLMERGRRAGFVYVFADLDAVGLRVAMLVTSVVRLCTFRLP